MRRLLLATAAVVVILLSPGAALAHSELVSAEPAEGATVGGPAFPFTLMFSEPLAEGSKAEVVKTGDTTVLLTILPDPADPTRMAFAPSSESPQFSPGDYTIQWTSVADDGDILRGTITFTVAAPTPTPSPTPTPAPSATPAPSLSAAPTPAPTTAPGDGSGSGSDVVVPIIAGLVLVGLAAWWLVRRRSSTP